MYFINIFYIVISQFIIFDKDFSDEVLVHWKLIRQGEFILIIFRKIDAINKVKFLKSDISQLQALTAEQGQTLMANASYTNLEK